MTLPIDARRLPADLFGVQNGQLPSNLLVQVGPSGFLHRLAAQAFLALVAAAAAAGIPLTFTYGGCYRTHQQQVSLFLQRYTTVYDELKTTTSYKYWNGVKYYRKRGVAEAAVPGTSNHGWGLAIDTALDSDTTDGVGPDDAVSIMPALDWLVANAALFGFSWELQSEPWHIRYCPGDEVPAAVAAWLTAGTQPAPIVLPAPPSEPAPLNYGLYPYNTNKQTISAGAVGDLVKYLQSVLRYECNLLTVITVDGQFGAKTAAAVRELQAANGLYVDGFVGKNTWAVVDYAALH